MEEHGGNIYDKNVRLDYSVNINPFGMPESVREAAVRGVELSGSYPDIHKRELSGALSATLRVAQKRLVIGSGAAELIYALAEAVRPKKALIVGPTFSEYEKALSVCGCEVCFYLADRAEGYAVTERLLRQVADTEELDMVCLCNPNNPTGKVLPQPIAEQLARVCEERGIRLLVDECFLEFSEEEKERSFRKFQEMYSGILVLRAFTKLYAMPGLRLGYLIAGKEKDAEEIKRFLPPWNVSYPAQLAGVAALREREFVRRSRSFLCKEREWLERQLCEAGYRVFPSDTIFFMFEGSEDLQEYCLLHGVYIRDAASFRGVEKGTWRIGVKTREENRQLVEILQMAADREKGGR